MSLNVRRNDGFQIVIEEPGKSELLTAGVNQENPRRPVMRLIHTQWSEFSIKVWVPVNKKDKPDPHFVQTTLKIGGQGVRMGVDAEDAARYLRRFRYSEEGDVAPEKVRETIRHYAQEEHKETEFDEHPDLDTWIARKGGELDDFAQNGVKVDQEITRKREEVENLALAALKKEVEVACKKDKLEEYLWGNQEVRGWRRHLSWVMRRKDVPIVLDYLFKNVPIWKKQCRDEERIYIPHTERVRYSFECCRNGTLWMYYTYHPIDLEEIQSLVIDLNTGESFHVARFDEAVGNKILNFEALFENNFGLLHFSDFCMREEPRCRSMIGKYELSDSNLVTNKIRFSELEKRVIAFKLLSGLAILENAKIIHCGINPSTILLRSTEAVLSNFEAAYFWEDLPKRNPFPHKWREYTPPECTVQISELKNPFAIPVYQLGRCFGLLFGDNPPLEIQAMLEGMCDPDPARRWDARLASKALSDYVPPLTESLVERDEGKE